MTAARIAYVLSPDIGVVWPFSVAIPIVLPIPRATLPP